MAREDWIIFDKRLMAILATVAVGTGVMAIYTWYQWTIFALFFCGLYFCGLYAIFPTRTALQRSISIGVFLGLLAGAVAWLYPLLKD